VRPARTRVYRRDEARGFNLMSVDGSTELNYGTWYVGTNCALNSAIASQGGNYEESD
jgi:hypothetical protein